MRLGWRGVALSAVLFWLAADIAAAQGDHSSQSSPKTQGTDSSVLGNFEKDIQPESTGNKQNEHRKESPRKKEHDDGPGGELVEGIAQGLAEVTMGILAGGGSASMQRIAPGEDASLYRNDGEPLIPFVRYDFAYQRASANISAHINRFEGGYGPLALYLEGYTFNERSPDSTLEIQRQMILYRMSGQRAEIDIGLGKSIIVGRLRTEINALSMRGRFMLDDNLSIDVQPIWGDRMNDYELTLLYGRQFGSLKIGYRSLASPGTSLRGPFAGFALYF